MNIWYLKDKENLTDSFLVQDKAFLLSNLFSFAAKSTYPHYGRPIIPKFQTGLFSP